MRVDTYGEEEAVDLAPGTTPEAVRKTLKARSMDYAEVQLVDPHLLGEGPSDKLGILDVKVTTARGKIVDIEIQLSPVPEMRERAIFYLSGMIREQIGPGESYRQIRQAICILITGYKEIHDSVRYHNRYWLYDPDSGSLFSKVVEINTLELPKLPEGGDETKLCAWLEFIRATKEEEFEMLARRDPDIDLAVVKLKKLSQGERLRELAISREKLEWDMASREHGAEQRGLERGLERGREEGQSEARRGIACKALAEGLPLATVMTITGLSHADLLALQSEGLTRH